MFLKYIVQAISNVNELNFNQLKYFNIFEKYML